MLSPMCDIGVSVRRGCVVGGEVRAAELQYLGSDPSLTSHQS